MAVTAKTSALRTPLIRDRPALHRALTDLLGAGPGADTNFGAALREAVREHDGNADPTREQVVLFLSDGRPTTQVPDPPPVGISPSRAASGSRPSPSAASRRARSCRRWPTGPAAA